MKKKFRISYTLGSAKKVHVVIVNSAKERDNIWVNEGRSRNNKKMEMTYMTIWFSAMYVSIPLWFIATELRMIRKDKEEEIKRNRKNEKTN